MPSHTRSSVLCVDDDQDACEMLRVLMNSYRIDVTCVRSAVEAWLMIKAERFDLYLLHAWLPNLDGFEFCRQIRALDANTPVLFYSGAAYDSDWQMGISAGANAYLVKPDVEGLIEATSRLIAEAKKAAIKPRSTAIENLIEENRRATFFDTSAVSTGGCF